MAEKYILNKYKAKGFPRIKELSFQIVKTYQRYTTIKGKKPTQRQLSWNFRTPGGKDKMLTAFRRGGGNNLD